MTISTRKKTGKCAGRVLIESDAELRDILRTNLAQVRIEVIQAKNNSEALKKSQTEKPDIVILDVTIPETLEAFEQLKSSPATSHIPVILMGTEKSLSRPTKPEIKADSYITKPFDPKEVVILAQAYLRNKKRSENINQISGLPGEAQFAYEIDCLVQQEKTFAAIYLDIDNLRDFNRIFGYDQGDLAIQMAADVAGEAVQRAGNEDDLVAHLGSDNFIVVTTVRKSRTVCRRILAEFDRRKKSLYSHDDLLKGFVEHENEMGIRQQYPLIGLRAAVVTNEKTAFHHYLQIIEAASEQLEYISHFPGVTNFYDLREAGMEPTVSGVPVT
ncbi:MAG: response regulator, partial [Calditrichaeota bacterium]